MLPVLAAQDQVEDTLSELNRRVAAELDRGQFVALADPLSSSEQSDRPTGIRLDEVLDRIQALTGPILDDDYAPVVLQPGPEEVRP